MNDKLYNTIELIKSKEDFEEFLKLLLEGIKNADEEWENNSLDKYLEALMRFTLDFNGYRLHNPLQSGETDPSWKTFAEILAAAINYE